MSRKKASNVTTKISLPVNYQGTFADMLVASASMTREVIREAAREGKVNNAAANTTFAGIRTSLSVANTMHRFQKLGISVPMLSSPAVK